LDKNNTNEAMLVSSRSHAERDVTNIRRSEEVSRRKKIADDTRANW